MDAHKTSELTGIDGAVAGFVVYIYGRLSLLSKRSGVIGNGAILSPIDTFRPTKLAHSRTTIFSITPRIIVSFFGTLTSLRLPTTRKNLSLLIKVVFFSINVLFVIVHPINSLPL